MSTDSTSTRSATHPRTLRAVQLVRAAGRIVGPEPGARVVLDAYDEAIDGPAVVRRVRRKLCSAIVFLIGVFLTTVLILGVFG